MTRRKFMQAMAGAGAMVVAPFRAFGKSRPDDSVVGLASFPGAGIPCNSDKWPGTITPRSTNITFIMRIDREKLAAVARGLRDGVNVPITVEMLEKIEEVR